MYPRWIFGPFSARESARRRRATNLEKKKKKKNMYKCQLFAASSESAIFCSLFAKHAKKEEVKSHEEEYVFPRLDVNHEEEKRRKKRKEEILPSAEDGKEERKLRRQRNTTK